ncbi:MAG: glycosyltransferase family 2 protein [Victivallales bacterium]|jgi:hyaluronan synthase|nr:glycosyltransferase family 2 protein [Victivallales bacterium]
MATGVKYFSDKNNTTALIKYGTFMMVLSVFIAALLNFSPTDFNELFSVRYVATIGVVLLCANIGYYAFLVILAYCFYRPHSTLSDQELPSCTVIIPAYNEGKAVLNALDSVLASDYPANKLEILAIDDGSEDDTWSWIMLAASRSGGRITPIRLNANSGKRHALYIGIKQSKAEVIVTVDSDSVISPETLRNLNSPFCDAKIAGVAGNIRALNLEDGLLPRMMDVNFVFGFEIMRSAQSVLGSVFCTPGALSSYRREKLLPFIDEWVNQTFLGEKAHIAEDRALTTFLLADRQHVVFQRNAVAHTILPSDYQQTCKMLLRWGRGDVRETCSMYRFAFSRFSGFQLGIQLNLLVHTMWIFMPLLMFPVAVGMALIAPMAFAQVTIIGLMGWSTVPAFVYCMRRGGSEALFAYTFAVYKLFFLFWVAPYCLISIRNSKWMTRGKKQSTRRRRQVIARRKLPSINRPAA